MNANLLGRLRVVAFAMVAAEPDAEVVDPFWNGRVVDDIEPLESQRLAPSALLLDREPDTAPHSIDDPRFAQPQLQELAVLEFDVDLVRDEVAILEGIGRRHGFRSEPPPVESLEESLERREFRSGE
ncbi:MAG: hypothetical protein R3F34_05575 [Planctomycetota bacterium]